MRPHAAVAPRWVSVCLVVVTSAALIVQGGVWRAAHRIETDFSNYYIPARLVARGESATRLYEFSWFQRQMEYAGIHDALGGFNYFPPPAGLALAPLGRLDAMPAKAAWTVANLMMVVLLVLVLRALSGLPLAAGLGLAALSGSALRDNFIFGQFYIALALLLATGLLLIRRERWRTAGMLFGVGTALKLYPGPLVAYLLVRRQWKATCVFAAAIAAAFAVSIYAFGWPIHERYFTSILPASLAGQTDNPYAPQLQSWTNVLRLLFTREPTLHPHPALDAPFLFYGLRDVTLLSLLGLLVFTIQKREDAPAQSLMILVLPLLSTSAFSYHTFLAIIPVGCWLPQLWRERRRAVFTGVVALYLFAVSPLAAGLPMWHLRLCALAALFFLLLREVRPWRLPKPVAVGIVVASLAHATWASRPALTDGALPIVWDAAHIESPTADSARLIYSALGCAGCRTYELRGQRLEGLPTGGHQLAPVFASVGRSLLLEILQGGVSRIVQLRDGSAIWWTPEGWSCAQPAPSADATRLAAVCDGRVYLFDSPAHRRLVTGLPDGEVADPDLSPNGARLAFAQLANKDSRWRLYELDLAAGRLRPLTAGFGDERGPRYSPDGQSLVFSRRTDGRDALWLRDLASGSERQLTHSGGNDDQPAWSTDGRSVYFASDRGRGIFMPAVYRLDLH